MSSPVVIAPTKSLCRKGVGRTSTAIQQQLRFKRLNGSESMRRRRNFGYATATKNKNTKPRLHGGSTSQQNVSSSPTILPVRTNRSSPATAFSIRPLSSLSTQHSQSESNTNTSTVMIATTAVVAVTTLLGGTSQSGKGENEQKQQSGLKVDSNEIDVTTGSQIPILPAETTSTLSTLIGENCASPPGVLSPLSQNSPNDHSRKLSVDLITGIKSALTPSSDAISSNMEPLRRQAVKNQISSQFHQPRNVMISRMRSVAGRGLHEKYKVDWSTVLGEGAYGSVHPARLALTGEKVALKKISKRFTNSSDFFSETDALLRIYDNGGHPNISGLRDMVRLLAFQG